MIPKITQAGPSIMERYWCGECGIGLTNPRRFAGEEALIVWKFCPLCGEPIEYDKAKPVQWAEQSCEWCGNKLITKHESSTSSYFTASFEYVGGPICRSCLERHCLENNCMGCEIGKPPDCPYAGIKKSALERERYMREEDDSE